MAINLPVVKAFEYKGKTITIYERDKASDDYAYSIEGGGWGCNLSRAEVERIAKKVAEEIGKQK